MDDAIGIELVARPLLFVALAALAFVPLERVAAAHPPRRRRFATDLAFATVGQLLVRAGLVLVVGWVLARLDGVAFDRPLLAGVGDRRARFVADTLLGLLLFELGGYAYHRLAHRVPAFWRLHEIHHSSEEMDWLASFRQHPIEILLVTLAQNAPLVLLRVPLGAHATVLVALKLATVFVHSNVRLRLGPLRFVFAAPRFHHRHHQRGGATANFASFLPLLDVVFGSYSDESAQRFGVERPLPDSFVGLLLAPLRRRDRQFEQAVAVSDTVSMKKNVSAT
jgi:sterol desaturase/sphingolipid hydroxylase (fatty acid hydroxylase superfamily)